MTKPLTREEAAEQIADQVEDEAYTPAMVDLPWRDSLKLAAKRGQSDERERAKGLVEALKFSYELLRTEGSTNSKDLNRALHKMWIALKKYEEET